MALGKHAIRPLNSCLRCIRQTGNGNASLVINSARLLSSTARTPEEVQVDKVEVKNVEAKKAKVKKNAVENVERVDKFPELDPSTVVGKRDERRLIRFRGVMPIGSRRRRAALQDSQNIPFEQLPYQCFQEARKVLQADRQEKINQIEVQRLRIANLKAQDEAVSGGKLAKENRLRSMYNRLEELKILADINDPVVKKRFEDGEGDMNKPIYRFLADRQWRQYRRKILEQRITQLNLVPDILPNIDPVAEVDLAFGRYKIPHGDFVDSRISENAPRLKVQVFDKGERFVTVVVVDPDVPIVQKDGFEYRCHFIASNIPVSPTSTSIALNQLDLRVNKATSNHIALPWLPPTAHKGAPYHRLAVFLLQQADGKIIDTAKVAETTKRDGFILRSFVDQQKLTPVGVTVFRTQWDESMAGVMQRAGMGDQVNMEFKRRRVEPLPYKKKDGARYR